MEALILALPDADPAEVMRAKDQLWIWLGESLSQVRPPVPTPAQLGYPGKEAWDEPGLREAVLADAFQQCVLDRLDFLKQHAQPNHPGAGVGPLVRGNIRDFVRDRLIRAHVVGINQSSDGEVLRILHLLGDWFLGHLRSMGLANESPRLLGYDTFESWREEECRLQAFMDCYCYAVMDRAQGLGAAAMNGQRVAHLVRINARRFISHKWQDMDPIGHRAYRATMESVRQARDRNLLEISGEGRAMVARFGVQGRNATQASPREIRSHLLGHRDWWRARTDLLGPGKGATDWLLGLLGAMPTQGILCFRVMELKDALRDALVEWTRPNPRGNAPRVEDREDPGPGPEEELIARESRFWSIFDREGVLSRIRGETLRGTREILNRMVEFLDDFHLGSRELVWAEMARTLGMTAQALNHHVRNFRGMLENCEWKPFWCLVDRDRVLGHVQAQGDPEFMEILGDMVVALDGARKTTRDRIWADVEGIVGARPDHHAAHARVLREILRICLVNHQ